MFEFIGTLSESRLIPSVANLRKFDAEELAELTVLYVCALYILYCHKDTHRFAVNYAKRTIQYGTEFQHWTTGGTDLYVMLYGLMADDVELHDPRRSDHFKKTVPIGEALLVRWLREMAAGRVGDSTQRALFTRLDFNFKILNSSVRAVRRLAMEWDTLDGHDHQLTMTRLLQLMRRRAYKGELLQQLSHMADRHGLELTDVCDVETGVGCGPEIAVKKAKKSGGSLLATLAGVAAGVAVSNMMHKRKS